MKASRLGLFFLAFSSCAVSNICASNNIDLSSYEYVTSVKLKANSDYKVVDAPKSIGIVGGGIGGTSSAYFLRQLFGNDVKIDLFDSSSKLGGRLATVRVTDRYYESGGSILHPKNMYAKSIAEKFGLKEAQSAETYTGFFNGGEYVMQTSQWSIITLFKFLWMFGWDFIQLMWYEKNFMDTFLKVYDLQKQGQSYTSVDTLFKGFSGDEFINATKITCCQLFADNGFGENLITNLVNPGLRINYGQLCDVNGFVGMVSMAGIQPGLWAVAGGNNQLCENLFENSKAYYLREEVKKVSKHSSGKFVIKTPTNERIYDIVVIAAPINRDKSNIDVRDVCSGKGYCPSAVTDPRHYRQTVATFVKGRLNPDLFQCDSLSSCPNAILTTKDLFYRSVGLTSPVDYSPAKGDSLNDTVYKVFSTDSLTEEQLSVLFQQRTEKAEVNWRAYPYYQPPDQLDTFVLNEKGVYYTSSIEWAASAIEMSLISAKNVALLAFNRWHGIEQNIDNWPYVNKHSEL